MLAWFSGAGDLSPGYQTAASAMEATAHSKLRQPAPVLARCYQRDDAVRPGRDVFQNAGDRLDQRTVRPRFGH